MASTTANDPWTLPELTRARRAIVVVDVVESVRLMQEDEAGFIERWRRFVHQVRHEVLPKHGGRMVKSLGDGMLLEFESVPASVEAAAAIQRVAQVTADRPGVSVRVGVHESEVVLDEFDVYGSGVNLAARLASLAQPGQIVVSAAVRDRLVPSLDAELEDMGECFLKHFESPVRAWRVTDLAEAVPVEQSAMRAQALTPLVAVVPFETVAEEAAGATAGDLLADSLIGALARNSGLRVLSRLSTSSLRGRRAMPWQRLSSLGVAYIVSGRCRLSGTLLLLTVELADCRSHDVLWSEQRQVSVSDLTSADSEVVATLCAAVERELARVELRRVRELPLPTLHSYALQLAAVTMMHRSAHGDFERVQPVLEHLIERHNRVASPRAWLAKWHVLRLTRGLADDPAAEARIALEHTHRALDSDPSSAMALAVEGFVLCHLHKDLRGAAQRLDASLAASPSESMAWLFRAAVHAFSDEGAQAMLCAQQAQALSALDPLRYYVDSLSAAAAVAANDHERAIEWAQRSLRANALHSSTYRTLAIAQVQAGAAAEAAATVDRLLALEPGFTIDVFLRRVPCGADAPIARRFAQALAAAGVPTH
jgi:class 3 adenylate cyclase/tetratricopeptide (TPR) repeat protein